MGIKFIKDFLWVILKSLSLVFFTFFYTKLFYLTFDNYLFGLVSVIISLSTVALLINSIFTNAMYRFLSWSGAIENGNEFNDYFSAFFFLAIIQIIMLLIATEFILIPFILKNIDHQSFSGDISILSRLVLWSNFIFVISAPFVAVLYAKEIFFEISLIEMFRGGILFLIAVFFFFFKINNLVLFSLMLLICSILIVVIQIYRASKVPGLALKLKLNNVIFKKIFNYSFWIGIGTAGSIGQRNGSEVLLNKFFGSNFSAVFSIGNNLSTLSSIFSKSLGELIVSKTNILVGKGMKYENDELLYHSTKYSILLYMFVSFLVYTFILNICSFWLGYIPANLKVVTFWLFIIGFLNSITNTISAFILSGEPYAIFMIIGGGVPLLSLLFTYIAFSHGFHFQFYFIIITIFLVSSLVVILILLKRYRGFNLKMFLNKSVLSILPAMILFLFNMVFCLKFESLLFSMFLYVLMWFATWQYGLIQSERDMLKLLINKSFSKLGFF